MDYKEFKRLTEKEEELLKLKEELANCILYSVPKGSPIIVKNSALRKIALRYIPVEIDEFEVFVDG